MQSIIETLIVLPLGLKRAPQKAGSISARPVSQSLVQALSTRTALKVVPVSENFLTKQTVAKQDVNGPAKMVLALRARMEAVRKSVDGDSDSSESSASDDDWDA